MRLVRRALPSLAAFLLVTVTAAAQSPSASGGNAMLTGQILRSASSDYLVSSNKAFVLVMQTDGNLCQYFGSSATNFKPGAVWCSNATGTGGRFSVQMHSTNNFCVTTGDEWGQGAALWCTNQVGSGSGPAFAKLDDFGNFFIKAGTPSAPGDTLWQTGITFPKVAITASHPESGSIRWWDGTLCSAPPPGAIAPQPVALSDGSMIGPCAKTVPQGSTISLFAEPPATNRFQAWNPGPCANQGPACTFTATANASIGLTLSVQTQVVELVRPATGTLRWSIDNSECGVACFKQLPVSTPFSVTAEIPAPHEFVSWAADGPCANQPRKCDLTVTLNMRRIAAVVRPKVEVKVILTEGSIRWGDGTTCASGECSKLVTLGDEVTVIPQAAAGRLFTEWRYQQPNGVWTSYACPETCTWRPGIPTAPIQPVFEDGTRSVVTATPPAGGTIVWPDDSTCTSRCSKSLLIGSQVTLRGVPVERFAVTRWESCQADAANPDRCTLTVARGAPQNVSFEQECTTAIIDSVCVALNQWLAWGVPFEGQRVVIRLNGAILHDEPVVPWPKYLGLQLDGSTIDATNTRLGANEIFTVGAVRYQNMTFYRLRAANGKYVELTPTRMTVATADGDSAQAFVRNDRSQKEFSYYPGMRWTHIQQMIAARLTFGYNQCLDPMTDRQKTNIVVWIDGQCFPGVTFFVIP